MKLHELTPAKGSRKERTRIGRGISAGQGKTSGRGQKGQGARTSFSLPKQSAGGQMPLTMRFPKLRGFNNKWRREFEIVNLSKLNRFDKAEVVDAAMLAAAGLVAKADSQIKVLGAGKLTVPVNLRVHRISKKARSVVEKLGGRVELVETPAVATESREE